MATPFDGVALYLPIPQFSQSVFRQHTRNFTFQLQPFIMKHFGICTLLLAVLMAPLASARLTLLRLSHGDQKLRGLTTRQEPSAYEAHL